MNHMMKLTQNALAVKTEPASEADTKLAVVIESNQTQPAPVVKPDFAALAIPVVVPAPAAVLQTEASESAKTNITVNIQTNQTQPAPTIQPAPQPIIIQAPAAPIPAPQPAPEQNITLSIQINQTQPEPVPQPTPQPIIIQAPAISVEQPAQASSASNNIALKIESNRTQAQTQPLPIQPDIAVTPVVAPAVVPVPQLEPAASGANVIVSVQTNQTTTEQPLEPAAIAPFIFGTTETALLEPTVIIANSSNTSFLQQGDANTTSNVSIISGKEEHENNNATAGNQIQGTVEPKINITLPANASEIQVNATIKVTNFTGNATEGQGRNVSKIELPLGNFTDGSVTSNMTGNLTEGEPLQINATFVPTNDTKLEAQGNETSPNLISESPNNETEGGNQNSPNNQIENGNQTSPNNQTEGGNQTEDGNQTPEEQNANGIEVNIFERNITSPEGQLNITERNITSSEGGTSIQEKNISGTNLTLEEGQLILDANVTDLANVTVGNASFLQLEYYYPSFLK